MNRSLHLSTVRTLAFVFAILGFPSVAHLEAEERPTDPIGVRADDPEAVRELTWIGGQALPLAATVQPASGGRASDTHRVH